MKVILLSGLSHSVNYKDQADKRYNILKLIQLCTYPESVIETLIDLQQDFTIARHIRRAADSKRRQFFSEFDL
jgi:hypothetical protein